MEYRKAEAADVQQVWQLVQNTIKAVYPKYYLKDTVEFFCRLHSFDRVKADIENGLLRVLTVDNSIVGTGSINENHITRLFISPEYQGKGFGGYIMSCIEDEISPNYSTAYLDSSLPAARFYDKRGYKTVRHEEVTVGDSVLVYEIMQRYL